MRSGATSAAAHLPATSLCAIRRAASSQHLCHLKSVRLLIQAGGTARQGTSSRCHHQAQGHSHCHEKLPGGKRRSPPAALRGPRNPQGCVPKGSASLQHLPSLLLRRKHKKPLLKPQPTAGLHSSCATPPPGGRARHSAPEAEQHPCREGSDLPRLLPAHRSTECRLMRSASRRCVSGARVQRARSRKREPELRPSSREALLRCPQPQHLLAEQPHSTEAHGSHRPPTPEWKLHGVTNDTGLKLKANPVLPARPPPARRQPPAHPSHLLTLLTLSEAKGGGVSVRSLIISTSETYCRFTSRISAWLGFPLEEGHSGGTKH